MVFINAFQGADVRDKVVHITEFSSALGNLLEMMCDGFGELQTESISHSQLVQSFLAKIDKHTADIGKLHEYNERQEINKDSHANLMRDLQQFILEFGSTSEQLRSELSALRMSTKQELFATQGAVEKLFTEALASMPAGGNNVTVNKTIVLNNEVTKDGSGHQTPIDVVSHDDALQMLADRLFSLEKKFSLSEVTNAKLREQLTAQLQAQDKFDLLTTQINQQDAQLQAQHDRSRIFEANLLKLKAAQAKTEKGIRDLSKKVEYLGSTIQKIIVNGNIAMPAANAADDADLGSFEFAFPDTSTLGEEQSMTLETDSIMQDIRTDPALSRPYLGAGGDPAAHDMIEALEQRIDDVFAPKILRLQDENGDLLGRMNEMGVTIAALEETIRGLQEREEEAKVRRREGRANFANDDEFYESLASLKAHWEHIFGDIEQKLAAHASDVADQKDFTEEDIAAIKDLTEFRNLLAENLHAFEAEDTVEATMDKLYPRLDSLNVEANRLFKTDRQLSRALGEEDSSIGSGGILDQIDMSAGRGPSFLKSQSSSFSFDKSGSKIGSQSGSPSPKLGDDSFPRGISRLASEVIPEGDTEEDSEGSPEHAPADDPVVVVKPSEMTRADEDAVSALSHMNSKRQRSLLRKSSSRMGEKPILARQPSALESFTQDLANACLSSAPILGERIDKGVLKRRIDRIEDGLANFALLVDLNEEVDHFARELDGKADKREVKELRKKKANLSDLQTLRDQMFEQMETLRSSVDVSASSGNGADGLGIGGGGRALAGDITQRFDKLYNQFQDLVAHCAGFVHRDEVETALQSIVVELKLLKSTVHDMDSLKKVVSKKADNWEVQRLISILSGGLQEPVLAPGATHQKCLSCDKPLVNPILQSLQAFGYAMHVKNGVSEEGDDGRAHIGSRPSTTGGGARTHSGMGNQHEIMSRSLSDAKAMKSGMGATGPAPGSAPNLGGAEGLPPLSKNRIRMSAGGGAGPSYTFDTK